VAGLSAFGVALPAFSRSLSIISDASAWSAPLWEEA